MKYAELLPAVSLIALLGLPSCEKVAEFAGKGRPPEEKGSAPPEVGKGHPHRMLGTLEEKMDGSRGHSMAVPVVRNLDQGEYQSFISSPGKLVVVDYHADWCGPCKRLSPVLAQLAADSGGKVFIGKVDVDANPSLAEKAGVRSIPDARLFRDGRQVDRFIGLLGRNEISKLFAKHSGGLDGGAAGLADSGSPPPAAATPAANGTSATIQRMDKNWMPPGIQKR